MKLYPKILPAVISIFFVTIPYAQAETYQIELIIFSHITAQGVNSEYWPILSAPTISSESPQITPNHNNSLSKEVAKLAQTPGYKVLFHATWLQDVKGPADAKWIHIYGGKGYDDAGNAVNENTDASADYHAAAHWQVDGLMRLDVTRYFDINYRLYFAAPMSDIQDLSNTDNFSRQTQALTYFEFNQFRRTKSGELNYIGHPLYGVLVNIAKVSA